MPSHVPLARCLAFLLVAVGLTGCTPPWWWLSTVDVDGRLLPDGRCEAAVRGNVARRLALKGDAQQVRGDNLEPLPPTALTVGCALDYPAEDPSRLFFYVPMPDTVRGVRPGTYRVVSDVPMTALAAPGTAAFSATVYPDPARRSAEWRDYRGVEGVLTLTSLTRLPPAPGHSPGEFRVTGTFHVRARRYLAFD